MLSMTPNRGWADLSEGDCNKLLQFYWYKLANELQGYLPQDVLQFYCQNVSDAESDNDSAKDTDKDRGKEIEVVNKDNVNNKQQELYIVYYMV